jgi:Ca2+-binding RTX toxin-like protein
LSPVFREIGIAIVQENSSATQVGPDVVTEDLGTRSTTGAFVLGVAYNDTDGNDFYSLGEGRAGLNVALGGTSVAGYDTGGYTLQTALSGAQTVVFSGAGLAGPVSVGLNLPSGANVKLDIVSGTELKTSASVVVSGLIAKIEAIGVQGLSLTGSGGAAQTIQGGIGADTVTGGSGQNYLRGGDGADTIQGGSGFDDANGNMGNDTIHGNAGDDYSVGGKDNDLLFGDGGVDIVWGNLGDDTCDGGDGNDQVRGGQGADSVAGGAGNDFVSGDRGDDTITGGTGADNFHGSQDAGIDRVLDFNLGEGDRVQLDPGTTYTVSQVGADTVLNMGAGNQMILVGVSMSSLSGASIFLG